MDIIVQKTIECKLTEKRHRKIKCKCTKKLIRNDYDYKNLWKISKHTVGIINYKKNTIQRKLTQKSK